MDNNHNEDYLELVEWTREIENEFDDTEYVILMDEWVDFFMELSDESNASFLVYLNRFNNEGFSDETIDEIIDELVDQMNAEVMVRNRRELRNVMMEQESNDNEILED